jgi:hypothetical protein
MVQRQLVWEYLGRLRVSPRHSVTDCGYNSLACLTFALALVPGCSSTPERAFDGVSATVNLPKASVQVGEPATIRLVLRNVGARDTALSLVGSVEQRFDILVLDSAGREIWSRLHQQDIDLGRIVLPLNVGDSLVFTDQWNQRDNSGRPVSPGSYEVRGHLSPRAFGDSALASARLRICPESRGC